ncbi:unnamed protein product [marine sediment metagenome]|uniref:Uncharacterized protein n=1 Tax=marine sediment metagenome TaxID=412755 RepID=X1H9L4_9ZZZZ
MGTYGWGSLIGAGMAIRASSGLFKQMKPRKKRKKKRKKRRK